MYWKENLPKKKPNASSFEKSKLFDAKYPFEKDVVQQKQILQDLALLIVKNHFSIQFVESIWLKHLVMHLCPRVVFPLKK